MKRIFLAVGGLVLAVALLAYLNRVAIMTRLVARVVEQNLRTDLLQELPDGLHVAICGAGSPLPDPERSGPCVAIMGGDRIYVVDAGSGSSRVMAAMRVPHASVKAVLLSHFHSDHIDGLGELLLQRWVNGSHSAPTPVIGPPGVDEVVEGLNQAYQFDQRYRVEHHGPKTVPPSGAGAVARPFRMPLDGEGLVVVDEGGWRITAFRVDHSPVSPAVGYRFDYAGRSVVLSGDTVKSKNVEKFAQGADLLVHEALSPTLVDWITEAARRAKRPNLVKIMRDIKDYHATPVDAAEIARDAGVDHLLYYHSVPPLLSRLLETVFLEGVAEVYDGPVTISRDGTLVSLPRGSQAIELDQLL